MPPPGVIAGGDDGRTLDLESAAPPWTHNPSGWRQRIPICVLAMAGFAAASAMALFQWGLIDSIWDPVFGKQTERVLTSHVSERMWGWFGIPDAAFGAIAYLGDAVFGLAGSTRRWQCRPWLVIVFGLDVIPLGIVSIVLVAMQGLVVGSWCFLCLVTAVISLILIVMAFDEVWSSLVYLRRVRADRGGDRRAVWNALWGRPVGEVAAPRPSGETPRVVSGGMWARHAEAATGCWLLVSPFVFGHVSARPVVSWHDVLLGLAVTTVALLAHWRPLRRVHFWLLPAAAWLMGFGWVTARLEDAPPFAQNHILVGLCLAMFAVLPSDSFDPPPAWREADGGRADELAGEGPEAARA